MIVTGQASPEIGGTGTVVTCPSLRPEIDAAHKILQKPAKTTSRLP
jgi:hypothetical protein